MVAACHNVFLVIDSNIKTKSWCSHRICYKADHGNSISAVFKYMNSSCPSIMHLTWATQKSPPFGPWHHSNSIELFSLLVIWRHFTLLSTKLVFYWYKATSGQHSWQLWPQNFLDTTRVECYPDRYLFHLKSDISFI